MDFGKDVASYLSLQNNAALAREAFGSRFATDGYFAWEKVVFSVFPELAL